MKHSLSLIALLAATSLSHAAITGSGDVNGLTTFTDTNTGNVWLRLDNFYDSATATTSYSYNSMVSTATNAGFVVADSNTLFQMLNTLPLTNGEWASYASIMGFGQPRGLIWGALADWANGSATPYAWAYSGDTSWSLLTGLDSNCTTAEVGGCNEAGAQDLGLWAYYSDNDVPEPASLALLGLGLGALATLRRKAKH